MVRGGTNAGDLNPLTDLLGLIFSKAFLTWLGIGVLGLKRLPAYIEQEKGKPVSSLVQYSGDRIVFFQAGALCTNRWRVVPMDDIYRKRSQTLRFTPPIQLCAGLLRIL